MKTDEINTLLATRTADLLAKWAGLPVLLNAKTIVAYVKKILDGKNDGAYVSFDTDYGPGRALSDLGAACGLSPQVWPNKSMMSVHKVYTDGSGSNSVSVSTGYHGRTTTYYLTCDGWLVANVNIPPALHNVVRRACERGEVDKSIAAWEPFKA